MKKQLRKALENLVKSAEEQESYLRRLGTLPSIDELALEFSDAFVVSRLRKDVNEAALTLDFYLESMSGAGNSNLWTIDALYRSSEWATIRKLAEEVLNLEDG